MEEKQAIQQTGYWAFLVSVFLMISKILGFAREIFIARKFGAGHDSDAYFVALMGIIIVVGALGTGLNTTLVPIFSEVRHLHGRRGKNRYFSNILSTTMAVSVLLVVVMYILAGPYASVLAPGYKGQMHHYVVYLIRMGLPMVVFLGITYVSNAYLQSDEVYGPHALMGIPYNLAFIAYLTAVAHPTVSGLMATTIVASSMQFFIQLPALTSRKIGYRFGIRFGDIYLHRTFRLILPVVLSSTVYQLNLLIDKSLASTLVEGSLSALNYASKVNTMVISVFVVAITTVVFPKLANALREMREKEAGVLFARSLNMVALVAVPSAVGMAVLAEPIIRLLFERGRFDHTATLLTASSLAFYAPGLIGQSMRMGLENMYYSLQDTKTPMRNGILSVAINIACNFLLIGVLQHRGLALATSISSLTSSAVLYLLLRRKIRFPERLVVRTILKITAASAVMGAFARLMMVLLAPYATGRLMTGLVTLGVIALSMAVYIACTLLLRVRDMTELFAALHERFSRKRSAA